MAAIPIIKELIWEKKFENFKIVEQFAGIEMTDVDAIPKETSDANIQISMEV